MSTKILAIIIVIFFTSCNTKTNNGTEQFDYKKTAIGTLEELYKIRMERPYEYDARIYYLRKHKDEVLKMLEVVEEVEVEKDVFLVFYKYSIGTETAKGTNYMRKVDGLYIPYSKYYSSYSDDPFKNGKGEEAKALLKKSDEWSSNENIWWAE
jgi:hypothetical protein